MKTYTFTPGIAACLQVNEYACIYLADGKLPVAFKNCNMREAAECFAELPDAIRAAVIKHFASVFALPLESRGAYLKTLEPWSVQA